MIVNLNFYNCNNVKCLKKGDVIKLLLLITFQLINTSFVVPIFAWQVPLKSPLFLKRPLVFTILLFSSIYLHWSLRKAFLSLLAILWNSAFRWLYLSFSPLPLASLPFSAICKACLDDHFAFLHFFFWGMVLITASCKKSRTSVHSMDLTEPEDITKRTLEYPEELWVELYNIVQELVIKTIPKKKKCKKANSCLRKPCK